MKLRPIHWLALAIAAGVALWWLSRAEEGEPAGEELDARGVGAGVIPRMLDALPGTWGELADAEQLPPGAVVPDTERPPLMLSPSAPAPAPDVTGAAWGETFVPYRPPTYTQPTYTAPQVIPIGTQYGGVYTTPTYSGGLRRR